MPPDVLMGPAAAWENILMLRSPFFLFFFMRDRDVTYADVFWKDAAI